MEAKGEPRGHVARRQSRLQPFLSCAPLPTLPSPDVSRMNTAPHAPFVGRSLPRREDHRLLTGRGHFIADLQLPHMLHAVFVRSPLAHARIRAVDMSRAASSPDVEFVLSGIDLA